MEMYEIGFLGYGKMAQAISLGLDKSGKIPYNQQIAFDKNQWKLSQAGRTSDFIIARKNTELLEKCKTIVLAVEPKHAAEALSGLDFQDHLIISIVAGLSLDALKKMLPASCGVVRAMPNTAALVGAGVTALCSGYPEKSDYFKTAYGIFEPLGYTFELAEDLFPALTCISGCGPAYFFLFMEAMVDGAVLLGFNREQAHDLVLKTALGSVELALSSPEAPLSELRAISTSPGGMTIEALHTLEKGAFRGLVQTAMRAALEKGSKLSD